MDAHRMQIRVTRLLFVVVSISSNGPEQMDAHGMNIPVPVQIGAVILIFCNGPERMAGCPWNEKTCSDSAEEGHLNTLQWARANGCPFDEEKKTA